MIKHKIFLRIYDDSKSYNCENYICSAFDPFNDSEIPSAKDLYTKYAITPREGAAYVCNEGSAEEVLAGIAISKPFTKSEKDYIGEWKYLVGCITK